MKILPQRTSYSILLVAALGLLLAILAVLQYRWHGQIRDAENTRMHASLQASMDQFRQQFLNYLEEAGFLLRPHASILSSRDWKSYARSCSLAWNSARFHLVRDVYVWIPVEPNRSQLLKLNRDAQSFEAAAWPAHLTPIRDRYASVWLRPPQPEPSLRPFMWTLFPRIPLLMEPLIDPALPPDAPGRMAGFILIELSAQTIDKEIFPALAQKYFQGPAGNIYQVAVIESGISEALRFQSAPGLTPASFQKPDARIPLIENPRERFGPMPPWPGRPSPPLDAHSPAAPAPEAPNPRSGPFRPDADFAARPRILSPIRVAAGEAAWELAAMHREGSLEAAVDKARMRHLGLSFGILLLLAASMVLIVIYARRAQRLARLQLDFVAGISHELRTPLAVICSAGDNLASGILDASNRSAIEYGKLILNEGRKLSGMVEQILQYAGTQGRLRPRTMRATDLNAWVDSVLQQLQPAIRAQGFTVEQSLEPGLPEVLIHDTALQGCIQNLIQNAMKYSGDSRWIAVRTRQEAGKHGPEVLLMIEDRGMGIEREDLAHIFEPFYRGAAAIAAQIHGTGLGLFLAREALASMQGTIRAKSSPGKGSIFTLRLRALPALRATTGTENTPHAESLAEPERTALRSRP